MMPLTSTNEGIFFEIGGDSSRFEAAISTACSRLESLEKTANDFGRGLSTVADPLFSALVKGLTLVTGAMTGIAAMALNVGGGFEAQMTRVAAISGATAQELDQLTTRARELGRDLPIAATDAAEAMTVMSQRGWTVANMLQAVGDVVNLSISQQHDLAESADILGATLTNFKRPVSDAGRIVDIFNNACNQSAMSMDKFGLSLKYVSPIASALGLSFESMVSMLESLSDAGFTAETMGTGLRMVLLKVSEAAGKGGGEFRKAGIEITDSAGKLKPVRAILEALGKSTLDLAGYQAIFGAEAATAALALSQNAGKLKEYESGLAKIGSTQEMVNRQLGTWRVTLDNLKSSLEEGELVVFDQIKDGAKGAVRNITDLVNVLTDWVGRTGVVHRSIDAFTEGLGISTASAKEFGDVLDGISIDEVAEKFDSLGSGARVIADAFMSLAENVPWKFISENIETIALTVTTVWGIGQIAGIVAGIAGFAGALAQLSIAMAAATGGPVTLGAAMAGVLSAILPAVAIIGGVVVTVNDLYDAFKSSSAASDALAKSIGKTKDELVALGDKELEKRIRAVSAEVERLQKIRDDKAVRGNNAPLVDRDDPELTRLKDMLNALKNASAERAKISAEEERINQAQMVIRDYNIVSEDLFNDRKKKGLDIDMEALRVEEEKRKVRWAELAKQEYQQRSDSGISEIESIWADLVSKAQNAMKTLGMSTEEAGRTLGESFAKSISEMSEKAGKAANDPFLTERLRKSAAELIRDSAKGYGELGNAASDAFGKMVKGAENSKSSLDRLRDSIRGLTDPMKEISDAIRGGWLTGPAAQKAVDWINKMTPTLTKQSIQQTMEKYGSLGLDKDVLRALASKNVSETLQTAGVQGSMSNRVSALFGDFMRGTPRSGATISAPITIQIDKVIATDERQARQSGENIGRGIVRPMQGLTY